MLDDLLKEIGKLAPAIGTVIGGPVGGLVGAGIGAAAKLITGKDTNEDIIAVLQANPDKLVELQKHAQEMQVETLKAYLQDTQNARQQTVELAKSGSPIAYGAVWVSILIVLGYFTCVYLLFTNPLQMTPELERIMIFMLGALQIGFGQVCNYWLGSSKGSADKTDVLMAAVQRK